MHKNTDRAGTSFSFQLHCSACPGIFSQLTGSTQRVNKPQTAEGEHATLQGPGQPGELSWYFGVMETPLQVCFVWVSAPQGWPRLMSSFPLSFNRASTWPREPARATRPTAELLSGHRCLQLPAPFPISESDVRSQPSHPQMQGRDKDLTITPLFGPSMFHLRYRKPLQAQEQDLSMEKAAELS